MKSKLYIAGLLFLAFACGKQTSAPNPAVPPDDYKLPEVPENVVSGNTFTVEFFLSLPPVLKIADHILNESGKKPLLYMFNRVEYVPGTACNLVQAAQRSKCYPFFIQNAPTSLSGNVGTGFLTRYLISNFDGECTDICFAGPTIRTALAATVDINMYNCNFSDAEQISSVVSSRRGTMYGDCIVLGLYNGNNPEEIKEFSEGKALGMRFDFETLGGKTIYTLMQPGFVNRGFEKLTLDGVDYVKVLFEKLY